jgi:hypothetical protein
MNIKKINKFNEDLSDAGIPKDFLNKAKEDKSKPNMQDFMKSGMESFHTINDVKRKESKYSNEELIDIALKTVKKLFKNNKSFNIDDVNFDLEILDQPSPELKQGTKAGLSDDDFTSKKNQEEETVKNEIDKRRIINSLTQGFAMASQEGIILEEDNDLPSELFQDYFKLMKITHDTHWNIPDEIVDDTETSHEMAVPLGRNFLKYDDETEQYTVVAKGFILIVLIHEMVLGLYELIAMHGQTGKSPEELKKVFQFTDTMRIETEGLKYGPEMVKHLRTFYNNLENRLIKKGLIFEKQDILASLLATFYTYPAREFISICEKLFSLKEEEQPFEFFEKIYMNIIDSSKGNGENEEEIQSQDDNELINFMKKDTKKSTTKEENKKKNWVNMGINELNYQLNIAIDNEDWETAKEIQAMISRKTEK